MNELRLNCQACRVQQAMAATTTPRFTPMVRVIGGILLVPSVLGLLFTVLMAVSAFATVARTSPNQSDAAMAGAGLAFGFMFIVIVICGVGSLVGGLLGWLLLMTKKVFKCTNCGFILDRA
jgi:hypothetical protein